MNNKYIDNDNHCQYIYYDDIIKLQKKIELILWGYSIRTKKGLEEIEWRRIHENRCSMFQKT